MIKKLLLPFVVIVGFIGFIIYGRMKAAPSAAVSAPAAVTTTVPGGASLQSSTSTTPATPSAPSAGQYKDGTYTGSVADGYYGNVQVQVVVANGAIADVEFLQYPNENGNTVAISQRSMPILKTEAVSAQSAQVDIVSGATQTSQAFQQSLAAALSQAS